MFKRVERRATPEDHAALFRAWVRASLRPIAAGSVLFAVSSSVAATLCVAAGEYFSNSPRPSFLRVWAGTLGWGSAMMAGLTVALVVGVLLVQRRHVRRCTTVAELEASWDAAVAVWGLADGELEVVYLRVEPGKVWVVEASSLGLEPGATEGPRSAKGVEFAAGELRVEGTGRMLVRSVTLTGRTSAGVARMVGRVVGMNELPEEVRGCFDNN